MANTRRKAVGVEPLYELFWPRGRVPGQNCQNCVVEGIDFRPLTTDLTEGSSLFIARINDLSQGIRQCPK